jgi:hypothetical protein
MRQRFLDKFMVGGKRLAQHEAAHTERKLAVTEEALERLAPLAKRLTLLRAIPP